MNIFPTIVLGFAHGNDRILLHNAPQIYARTCSSFCCKRLLWGLPPALSMPDLVFGALIWELTIYHLSTGATTKRQTWFHNSYKEENSLPLLLPPYHYVQLNACFFQRRDTPSKREKWGSDRSWQMEPSWRRSGTVTGLDSNFLYRPSHCLGGCMALCG